MMRHDVVAVQNGMANAALRRGLGCRDSLDALRAGWMRWALRNSKGVVRQACRCLEIPNKTFYRWARRYKIDIEGYRK